MEKYPPVVTRILFPFERGAKIFTDALFSRERALTSITFHCRVVFHCRVSWHPSIRRKTPQYRVVVFETPGRETRTDRLLLQCVPILGRGFESGGYKCECLQGYEYPFEDLITYYDGQLVEAEFLNLVVDNATRWVNLQVSHSQTFPHPGPLPPPALPLSAGYSSGRHPLFPEPWGGSRFFQPLPCTGSGNRFPTDSTPPIHPSYVHSEKSPNLQNKFLQEIVNLHPWIFFSLCVASFLALHFFHSFFLWIILLSLLSTVRVFNSIKIPLCFFHPFLFHPKY